MLNDRLEPYVWDEKTKILIPGDKDTTIYTCVAHFLDLARECIEKKGSFSVALFGGSTPKPIYELLAIPEDAKKIDWSKVYLFWSDERSVPPTHEDSNYHMAMHHGMQKLPIPEQNIFRMKAEEKIEQHAMEYENQIQKVLKKEPFDLIMLGVGEDGHTASLFPNTAGLHIQDRLVAANYVPQKSTWRMTFTFPLINASSHTVIYVFGSEKKEIIHKVFTKTPAPEKFPCQYVGTKKNPALWILDQAAAQLILPLLQKNNSQ